MKRFSVHGLSQKSEKNQLKGAYYSGCGDWRRKFEEGAHCLILKKK